MHDARDVAEQGEEDVEPEVPADADLEEHAERRQQDGEDDAYEVHTSLDEDRRRGLQDGQKSVTGLGLS